MLGIILFIGQAVVPVKFDKIYISIVTNSLWKMFSNLQHECYLLVVCDKALITVGMSKVSET